MNRVQVAVDHLCCQRTPLAHVQLSVYQHLLGLFRKSAAQTSRHASPHSLDESKGLLHLWCRTQHLSLLNFVRFLLAHSSSMSRSFWMAALPTSMLTVPSAWSHLQISWVTNTLSPPLVIFKDIKQDRSQDRPLQCSTCFSCYWPLHKVWSIIRCLLGLTIQTICCLLNMTEMCEPKYMDVLRVIVENFAVVY